LARFGLDWLTQGAGSPTNMPTPSYKNILLMILWK
jgi:hypothetical protein